MAERNPVTCDRYGIALFGTGRAGSIHFGNIVQNKRANLLYVIDLDTAKAQEMVNRCPMPGAVKVIHPDDRQQVFDDQRVAGILVCSPTFTHEEIVKGGLEHGKDVFCEKPLSETLEGTEECYKIAKKAGRSILCSFNRRFDPSICQIRERLLAKEIGDVHVIKTCSRDHPLPAFHFLKTSGGMFHDCAVHDIDMVCWLLGEYPVSVYAQAHTYRKDLAEINDVDTVAIVCKYASGILCTIDLSRHSTYGYDQRMEVFGSGGMLQSQNHASDGVVKHNASGVTGSCYQYSFPQRYAESYTGALRHFLDVLAGASVEVTEEQVLKACKVTSACEASYRSGLPVTLAWE